MVPTSDRNVKTLLTMLLLLVGGPCGWAAMPERVVSYNLCADQLVLALADPAQILGLSPYAADPSLSILAQEAKPYPRLEWDAEATISRAPDLVLVGMTHRTIMQHRLRQLGLNLVQVDLVTDIESARAQIRMVADLLGHPQRGEALLARLDAARARLAAAPRPQLRTALVVERGGYTAGPESLAATLLREAGLTPPPGAPAGYGGYLPLEALFTLRPDLLVIKDPPAQPNDQGSLFFMHPAVQALYPPQRRIALPSRYTLCGGPALIAAFDYLTDVLTKLSR
jgi:iron complex transport system substrate-binding protein